MRLIAGAFPIPARAAAGSNPARILNVVSPPRGACSSRSLLQQRVWQRVAAAKAGSAPLNTEPSQPRDVHLDLDHRRPRPRVSSNGSPHHGSLQNGPGGDPRGAPRVLCCRCRDHLPRVALLKRSSLFRDVGLHRHFRKQLYRHPANAAYVVDAPPIPRYGLDSFRSSSVKLSRPADRLSLGIPSLATMPV